MKEGNATISMLNEKLKEFVLLNADLEAESKELDGVIDELKRNLDFVATSRCF